MKLGLLSAKKLFARFRADSLWVYTAGGGCCADEVLMSFGARYDLERFGCREQIDPGQADLLIVNGGVTKKAAPYLKELYERMVEPRYVLALGACACSGGPFSGKQSSSTLSGVGDLIPVDIYVPGCPPRPEAIMNGLINLQEKILGAEEAQSIDRA